jgi:hypothetical protein
VADVQVVEITNVDSSVTLSNRYNITSSTDSSNLMLSGGGSHLMLSGGSRIT